jgi:hypothetical protein
MRRVTLSLVAALVTVAAFAGPVLAAKPTIERIELSGEAELDAFLTDVCGFDVWVTRTGHIVVRTWTDEEGNVLREIVSLGIRGSLTAGGAVLTFVDTGMDKITSLPGGGVQVEIHGNLGLLTVKGMSPVAGAAGRFVFQRTPVLDEEGNPVLDEEGNPVTNFEVIADSGLRVDDLEAVCAALAPPA